MKKQERAGRRRWHRQSAKRPVLMMSGIRAREERCPRLHWCGTCHHGLMICLNETSADTIVLSAGCAAHHRPSGESFDWLRDIYWV